MSSALSEVGRIFCDCGYSWTWRTYWICIIPSPLTDTTKILIWLIRLNFVLVIQAIFLELNLFINQGIEQVESMSWYLFLFYWVNSSSQSLVYLFYQWIQEIEWQDDYINWIGWFLLLPLMESIAKFYSLTSS